jgi:tetratricopeptide (TPR) repeat protein
VAAVTGAAACRQPERPRPAVTAEQALSPITLPNLETAADTVRTQITERYREAIAARDRGVTSRELAAGYGELGKVLLAGSYLDAAEAAFRNAEAAARDDYRWPYLLGHTYRQRNDPATAATAFARALALRPDDVPAMVWLGETELNAGKPDAAASPLEKAVTREPANARANAALGKVALARRDYAGAVARFDTALRLAPTATALHYQLSLAHRRLGDAAAAEAHLRLRGATEPAMRDPLMAEVAASLNSAMAFDSRSRAALARGDWQAAAAEAKEGLGVVGSNATLEATLHHRLGTALAQMNDRAGARAEFERAVAAAPDFAAGHYSLGVLLAARGDRAAALREFANALNYEPGYLPARLARADALRQSGQGDEARVEYAKVLTAEPASPAAQFGDALALYDTGAPGDAIEALTRAVAQHPTDRALALALARLLAAAPAPLRNGTRALALAEPIVRAEATFEGAETMALALAALGRFDEAATLEGQAIAQAQSTEQRALARAMAVTRDLYVKRRMPSRPWREQPLYEPTR